MESDREKLDRETLDNMLNRMRTIFDNNISSEPNVIERIKRIKSIEEFNSIRFNCRLSKDAIFKIIDKYSEFAEADSKCISLKDNLESFDPVLIRNKDLVSLKDVIDYLMCK